jgi:DNA-binding CsgD family transcriptional regulator
LRDPIALVEAAYHLAPDESAWLDGLAQAARPMLDAGSGSLAFIYDATDAEWASIRAASSLDVDAALAGGLLNVPAQRGDQSRWLVNSLRATLVTTARRTLPRAPRAVGEHFGKCLEHAGFADARVVIATDPSRIGVTFVAPSASPCAWAPRDVNRWSRIASHVAAGLRIRRRQPRLASVFGCGSGPEAILRPDGRVEHAEAPAQGERERTALRRGALALDRARGPLRRHDADEALGIWEGLVAGRWSLVDHVDSDRRRYLLAHRNDPDAPDVRGLTLRERQVLGYVAAGHSNKVIAYELGLRLSTVAGHLTRAKRKLGSPSLAAIRDLIDAASLPK